jgi:hypothetical protein
MGPLSFDDGAIVILFCSLTLAQAWAAAVLVDETRRRQFDRTDKV